MKNSPEDIRLKLEQFSIQLKKLSFPTSPISVDLAKFVSSSLDRYIAGEAKNLDSAFGLIAAKGRPQYIKSKVETAKNISALIRQNPDMRWEGIFELHSQKLGCKPEERELRRTFARYKEAALIEYLSEEIEKDFSNDNLD